MRFINVFLKTMREMFREWMTLALTLVFAPFFVFTYWVWTAGGSTSYNVLVLNYDSGISQSDGTVLYSGEDAIQAIENVRYADGEALLNVLPATDRKEIETVLRDRGASAFVVIPEDFSQTVQALRGGDRSVSTKIVFGGDLTNPYYVIGGTLAISAVDSYVMEATGQQPLVTYVEEPLGASAARTEFETYVPGVLILAVVLLIFQAAMTVAREVEGGTLRRLQLTSMTSFDLLGGITAALVLVAVAGVILTFLTAVALGFRSQGPVWVAILIGAMSSLSIIGVGMVVACFSRTVNQAFIIANFPLAFFMFFTGAIFPIPGVTLFTLGGREIGLYDILPPTHAVVALNKVLTLGAGLGEVVYELAALVILSVIYFALGVLLFQRMHLR